jgi:tetratricopeptide (TPR) repeat protein
MQKIIRYFHQHDRGWVLSLFAACCSVYLPFLGNPFFFDDLHFFTSVILGQYAHSSFNLDLRWFPYYSFGWTAEVFSDVVPHFFHLGNLLLHATNTILVFYVLREIVGAVNQDRQNSPELILGAWIAALIFAVHPVAVFAVGYTIQRSIVMATLFVLLMQMAYLRGMLTGQIRWLVLSVTCYFLAVFSKEHSVLAPAILASLTLLLRSKISVSKRALWLTWSALFAVAVLVTLRSRGVLGIAYEPMAAELFEQQGLLASTPMLHLLSAMTQAGLFFKYLFLWIFPNVSWMSVDMREPFVTTSTDWYGWMCLLAFMVYGIVATRWLLRGGKMGLIGFALLYPWLQFGIELVGIRVQEPFVLYRSYLWMPGMLIFVPLLMMEFPTIKTKLIFGCLVVMLIPLAWNRLWVFADSYRLWNDAAILLKHDRVAGADRVYYNRGQALLAQKKWDEAAKDFERSVSLSPQLAPIHHLLGEAYKNSGRLQEALAQFDTAITINGNDDRYHYGKGMVLRQLGRKEEFRAEMILSCRLNNFVACLMVSPSGK